jgi:hypothetical protein
MFAVVILPIMMIGLILSIGLAIVFMLVTALASGFSFATAAAIGSTVRAPIGQDSRSSNWLRQVLGLLLPAILLGTIAALMFEFGTASFFGSGLDVGGRLAVLVAHNVPAFLIILCAGLLIRQSVVSIILIAVAIVIFVMVPIGLHPFSPYDAIYTALFIPVPAQFLQSELLFYNDVTAAYRVVAGWSYVGLLGATIFECWRIRTKRDAGSLVFKIAVGFSIFTMIWAVLIATRFFGLSS